MSTDPVLTDAGYNHSFAMIDFKSVSSCVKFYDKPNYLKHGYKNHTKSISLSFRNSAYSIFLNTVHVLINKNFTCQFIEFLFVLPLFPMIHVFTTGKTGDSCGNPRVEIEHQCGPEEQGILGPEEAPVLYNGRSGDSAGLLSRAPASLFFLMGNKHFIRKYTVFLQTRFYSLRIVVI